ncbi:thiamine phosphate synthase [Bacillus sp. MRMR6]|uniref:thiamine phosphate synthase n=1 Tax=Bacillus sp. MRMR6 TaxID=1928617 RepID=UPI0011150F98|nr:thiamine phosphate synthase [Bacillus sp. MRMR6]
MNQEKLRTALKVYFIMGSPNCLISPEDVLKEAIAGGITLFQFREKGEGALEGTEKYLLAKKLQQICRKHDIPFIINDDIELAILLNADGVHIGQEDEPIEKVREKIGKKILGVSVHTPDEAEAAIQGGADYFGIGPVFTTKTKKDARATQGTTLIEALRGKGFKIPIVGIGGISVENASTVFRSGADGVAVITAITHAASPLEAVRTLRNI